MRFRGGGIGHKVTCKWDEFLQHKGRKLPPDDEDICIEVQTKDSEDELEWEVGDGMDDGMDEEGDELGNPELKESEGEEDDVIVADKGEELNEDIWAQEGYGSL